MKELILVDGRIYLAEPIQANPLLEKTVAKIQLRFQKETFIKALEERLTKCEKELAAAVANDSIINVGEHVITFFNEDKTAGRFLLPSFKAMESAVEKLRRIEEEAVDCATLSALFTRLELNQLKKALVTHVGGWDRGASTIEEIEFSKENSYVPGDESR